MLKRVSLVPKFTGVCVLLLIALSLTGSIATALAEESVSVACYAGKQNVGSVVVFDVADSARACNSMYYDCRGRCVGCIYDYDYVHDVCVDISGRTFLRP